LVLREFPFAEKSQGTPCWVDGFVIPKGKLAKKQAAISAFLLYIQSPEAFRQFAQPSPDLAASNLLPAVATAYEDQELMKMQPLLENYRQVLGDGFLISDSATWLGMREAGKQLRGFLKPEKPK
jgi:spermidine/putrescine-binding protein